MSGIYIHGMEMPRGELGAVPVIIFADGTVHHYMTLELVGNAIPVPDHGRLIDADALIMDRGIDTYAAVFAVANAPTIIPASEEDAKTEEDAEPWLCLSCRNYPPSSTDGKPCSQCNTSDVWHSCWDPAEEGET